MTNRAGWAQDVRALFMCLVVLTVMSVAALVILAAAVLTLFQARRLYVEVLARGFARLLLLLCGVRLRAHRDQPWPTTQTVYISNHTSALDIFILLALGLPRTRFFLSGFLRAIAPMGVVGWLAGTFWTMPQSRPQERVRLFERAERVLRETGESVYLSPEGMRILTGEIGPFNKGAFHLAGNLGASLLPLYLAVPLPPRAQQMGRDDPHSYTVRANLMAFLRDFRPCVAHVYVDTPIQTKGWRLEDLDRNRQQVRERFLTLHAQHKAQ